MISELFKYNIALLEKKDPDLAALLRKTNPDKGFYVAPSHTGFSTLFKIFPDGTRKSLLSAYDPVKEAKRLIDSCSIQNSENFIVIGLGLGYHALELVKRASASSRIIILEKKPELLRLAMTHNDFKPLLTNPGVKILVDTAPEKLPEILENEQIRFTLNGYTPIFFKALIHSEEIYYKTLLETLNRMFQSSQVDLKTQAAFSKSFYQNILGNFKNILTSPGITSIKNRFQGIPALIISAGPSLDKNIGLLKSAGRYSLLLVVGTALRPLLKSGIKSDFVFAIDPDETTIKAFDLKSIPENLWLVYNPCVPRTIPDYFHNRKMVFESGVYLSKWISAHHEKKGSLGKSISVGNTAFVFANHLGCDPIILVGQDLCFTSHRRHCSGSFYSLDHEDQIGKNQTVNALVEQNFHEYSQSLSPVCDIFGQNTSTTLALDTYKNHFAEEACNSSQVYNATEGGMTIPGIENLSLKEALNKHRKKDIRRHKNDFSKIMEKPGAPIKIFSEMKIQRDRFMEIKGRLTLIQSKFGNKLEEAGRAKNTFVQEMDVFYKFLLEEPDSIKLLQGYSYGGFIKWNQENSKILLLESNESKFKVEDAKYQRDLKFFPVLAEAVEFMIRAFERLTNGKQAD